MIQNAAEHKDAGSKVENQSSLVVASIPGTDVSLIVEADKVRRTSSKTLVWMSESESDMIDLIVSNTDIEARSPASREALTSESGTDTDARDDRHTDEKRVMTDGGVPTCGTCDRPLEPVKFAGSMYCAHCHDRKVGEIIDDVNVEPGDRVRYDGREWTFLDYCVDYTVALVPVGLEANEETVKRGVDVRDLSPVVVTDGGKTSEREFQKGDLVYVDGDSQKLAVKGYDDDGKVHLMAISEENAHVDEEDLTLATPDGDDPDDDDETDATHGRELQCRCGEDLVGNVKTTSEVVPAGRYGPPAPVEAPDAECLACGASVGALFGFDGVAEAVGEEPESMSIDKWTSLICRANHSTVCPPEEYGLRATGDTCNKCGREMVENLRSCTRHCPQCLRDELLNDEEAR